MIAIVLDLRALVDTTGNTAATTLSTIPANDGAVIAGVPLVQPAELRYISFDELVAGTPIKTLKLFSNDLPDPQTGFDLGVSFPPDFVVQELGLRYQKASMQPQYSQTAAAKINAGLHWDVPSQGGQWIGSPPKNRRPLAYTTTFGAALTADAWGAQAFAPATIPNGRMAILGWRLSAVTKRALVRFSHPEWGGVKPGLATPQVDLAATVNELALPTPFGPRNQGRQFSDLSDLLGGAYVPTFPVGSNGTGLNIEVLSNTADTPKIDLVLAQVA